MNPVSTILALAVLLAPAATSAQAPEPAQAARDRTEPGFFRPAKDPSLNPPVETKAVPAATAPVADESRRAAASLERIEASMDRVERDVAKATAPPVPLPPIASPLDGTAPILSPLDGTAPLITPTAR